MIAVPAPPKAAARAIAIALLLLPVVLASFGVWRILVARAEHHERVERLLVEEATARALAGSAPSWDARIAALRREEAGRALFFALSQSSGAATHMETAVTGLVNRNGGVVQRDNVELHDAGGDAPQELRATVVFVSDISQLTHILLEMRRMRPLLFVDELEVKTVPDASGKAGLRQPNRLQVDATLVSYLEAR
jgi:Type II secretion system (T2SS), protein M subtype b